MKHLDVYKQTLLHIALRFHCRTTNAGGGSSEIGSGRINPFQEPPGSPSFPGKLGLPTPGVPSEDSASAMEMVSPKSVSETSRDDGKGIPSPVLKPPKNA